MKLNKELEYKVRMEALKYLMHGKPGWDVPHTYNAVRWMRKLIEKEGGNEKILVTAMYLHDIGYPILRKGYNFKELITSKEGHAEKGAKIAKKILFKLKGFTTDEIEEIVYLIKNHSDHHNVKEFNRKMVMDADGLSMLDWEVCLPTLDKKGAKEFLAKYFKEERSPDRWNTKTGKKYLNILYKKALNYWD